MNGVPARAAATLLAAVMALAGLAACSSEDHDVVALLLPAKDAARYTEVDRPLFTQRVQERCPDCKLKVYFADHDAQKQRDQARTALDEGADVLVLDAVDRESGEEMVKNAGQTPVVAYDRFLPGVDYYVSHDNQKIGRLQAQGLSDALGKQGGRVLMLTGPSGDPSAAEQERAVRAGLSGTKVTVAAEHAAKDWTAQSARVWVGQQLKRLGAQSIDGVYAGNDQQAAGAIQALRQAGVPDGAMPVVTGQDAELDAVRRIVAGTQTLTISKQLGTQAEKAADIAASVIDETPVKAPRKYEGVPSFIYDPVLVTLPTLTNTVVRQGQYTPEQICSKDVLRRCEDLGIR